MGVVVSSFSVATMALLCIAFSYEVPFMLAVLVFFSSAGVTLGYVWARTTWFGIMVWLVYLSALLVMFLFFVSLAPNPDFSGAGGWALKVSSFGVAFCLTGGVALSGVGSDLVASGAMEGPALMNFWVGSSALFMAGLAAYLFFVMVVVSKLAYRDGGALRGISSCV